MGYRSDITIKAREKAFKKIMKAVGKSFTYREIETSEDDTFAITIPDVKWYEGVFPEVDRVLKTLDELDEKAADDDYAYCFFRDGEESMDYDKRFNGDVDISLVVIV